MDKATTNKCELCNGTKFYGDNGPGRVGNNEFVRCEICNPDTPTNGLDNKSAEWQAGYLWGLSGAAEVKESHDRLLEAAKAVYDDSTIHSVTDYAHKRGLIMSQVPYKLIMELGGAASAIEAQGKEGKG